VIEWVDTAKDLVIIGYTPYKWYKEITRQKKKRPQPRKQSANHRGKKHPHLLITL
jgi:hypothetical protein